MLVLQDIHKQAIAYMLEGKTHTDIANLCGVHRSSIYNWLKDGNFKAELDRQKADIKTNIDRKIASRADIYIEQLHKIATTGKTEKERRAACEYLMDRILGKATSKIATDGNTTAPGEESKVVSIEEMLKNIGKTS